MSSRSKALVTPSVMEWARKQSGLTVPQASKKIGRPTFEIENWESGNLLPSIAQARKASEVYKRPLSVFYLPTPPKDFSTLRDFRSLPNNRYNEYSYELRKILRSAYEHQSWLKNLFEEENLGELEFIGSVDSTIKPNLLAEKIINDFGVDPKEQISARNRDAALNYWITKIERGGVFVFRSGKIDLLEARGIAITDPVAPFIYINSDDSRAAQLFTLIHELAHLYLNQSGISNLDSKSFSGEDSRNSIELLCNQTASQVLLYNVLFSKELRKAERKYMGLDIIEALSKAFKVSEECVARRLLDLGKISKKEYLDYRKIFQDRWVLLKAKEKRKQKLRKKSGGPSRYVMTVFNNGYSFTQTVINSYEGGQITGREASSLLNTKVNNLNKLVEVSGIPSSLR